MEGMHCLTWAVVEVQAEATAPTITLSKYPIFGVRRIWSLVKLQWIIGVGEVELVTEYFVE